MEQHKLTDALQAFGLTRQEALLYLCLSENGLMTGYEAAKQTGISRSNAYTALAGLVEKGAACTQEGSAVRYASVDVDEFCRTKLSELTDLKNLLKEQMPKPKNNAEGYLTITGDKQIESRIKSMLKAARYRVYVQMSEAFLERFLEQLEEMQKNEIKVVLLTDKEAPMKGVKQYLTGAKGSQIGIITDSENVLTGEFGLGNDSTCLYTGQKNFVRVFKESMRNEIRLTQLAGKGVLPEEM